MNVCWNCVTLRRQVNNYVEAREADGETGNDGDAKGGWRWWRQLAMLAMRGDVGDAGDAFRMYPETGLATI